MILQAEDAQGATLICTATWKPSGPTTAGLSHAHLTTMWRESKMLLQEHEKIFIMKSFQDGRSVENTLIRLMDLRDYFSKVDEEYKKQKEKGQ